MKPNCTKSRCSCLTQRFCLRPLLASVFSHNDSLVAYSSSLLGVFRFGYLGSTTLLAKYFLRVFREMPVLRAISRIGT